MGKERELGHMRKWALIDGGRDVEKGGMRGGSGDLKLIT